MARRLLIWTVVAQMLLLVVWAGYHEYLQRTATTIRLKVLPVDPRDPFRGDFMILNYEISRTTVTSRHGEAHGNVWVALRSRDGWHVIDEVLWQSERPSNDGRVWVLARAVQLRTGSEGSEVQLRYGIEEFFVPEGRGTPRFDRMEIEAAVSPSGRLFLTRAWLDGEIFP